MSNFNSTIKQNTLDERVKILTALIEKKKVYYYVWNTFLNRMERMVYTSDKAPDFGVYRYESDSTYAGCKTTIKFECGGFVNNMITSGYFATPDRSPLSDSQIKVWFDIDKNLNIELLNEKIVVHPHPKTVPVEAPVQLEKKDAVTEDAVERLLRSLRAKWRAKKQRFRTAQFPTTGGDYMYFSTSDMVTNYYTAVFKLKDCVLVSKAPISRNALMSLRLYKRDKLVFDQVNNVVLIDGYQFEKLVP